MKFKVAGDTKWCILIWREWHGTFVATWCYNKTIVESVNLMEMAWRISGNIVSSDWTDLSRDGCWATTYQLVKLLVHCLVEGSKKSSRKLRMWNVLFSDPWRRIDCYWRRVNKLSTRLLTAFFRKVKSSFTSRKVVAQRLSPNRSSPYFRAPYSLVSVGV